MVKSLPAEYYAKFLSDAARARKPSPIRALFPLEARPGMLSLLAGKPNAQTFPFISITVKAASLVDPSKEIATEISGRALSEGLQYGPTAGSSDLIGWMNTLHEREHKRMQGEGWRVSVGSGSQDLIHKARLATINALVNPGDSVLVESPIYAGMIPTFEMLNCDFVGVPTDSQGIDSSALRKTLESWPASKPKPRILYTVPYGGNPTGMTTIAERRLEVLALAREHDFLILEDDPYYFLYFGPEPRPQSYFALEATVLPEVGRVLRFDSLSKVLSAGIRLGFLSGPVPVLAAVDVHTAQASLQVSGLTQAIAFSLLDAWGHDAFVAHTRAVSAFYRAKRDVFERHMRAQLSGLAQWDTPEAGMFFWFKLLLRDPGAGGEEEDSESVVRTKALEKGVLALPGTVFIPGGKKTAYVRASFSQLDEPEVEEACKRLRAVVLDARGAV
ncbi:PLP-dependent transferase [Epithele typhae]|uniref:PLP-dependent transferase n=1 Tax=Epithele typhae TaxID=378194 RepID=UPI00200740EC|nr:PLP-dependent transferase [Epithele typhae]KAH9945129.1 PLP-dependent transferase [Epithele typhae]